MAAPTRKIALLFATTVGCFLGVACGDDASSAQPSTPTRETTPEEVLAKRRRRPKPAKAIVGIGKLAVKAAEKALQPGPAADEPPARNPSSPDAAVEKPARPAEKAPVAAGDVDVKPAPMAWIPSGTIISEKAPKGWTDMILLANPRFAVGDVNSIPSIVIKNSSMFFFTILAKTAHDPDGLYSLQEVAMGYAVDVDGRKEIRSSNDRNLNMGFISKQVFAENEKIIERDVRRVARTRTMMIFDASAVIKHEGTHRRMIIRHAVVVNAKSGELTTFVWLLEPSDDEGDHRLEDATMQKLPHNFIEDRQLSVNSQRFNVFGVPQWDAIALVRIPQGKPVAVPPDLTPLAAAQKFTPEGVVKLERRLLSLAGE